MLAHIVKSWLLMLEIFVCIILKSLYHRRARLVIPYQARFKISSCSLSNSSKNREFIQTTSQFQEKSENLKRENLNFQESKT